MKSRTRTFLLLMSFAGALLLAGCDSFDPTEMFDLDFLNTKKKLQGDRRPVFPEGTPGVPQGVPPELVRGNQAQAQPETTQSVPQQAAAESAEAKPEPKPKAKPKPKVVAKPKPPESATASAAQPAAPQSPWPEPPAAPQRQSAGAWPSAPQSQNQSGVQWPEPPPTYSDRARAQ